MKKLFNRIICFFLGHERKATKELYGYLNNGRATYYLTYGKCERCSKL